jgi:hypothetical protein
MTERQWIWGLSNGVLVLALSGFVWVSLGLGVGFHPAATPAGLASLFAPLAVLNLSLFALLLRAGIRLRRQAGGFRFADLRRNDPDTQRILKGLRRVLGVEAVLISMAGFLSWQFQRGDLAWPWIAFVIGVHFVPLARLFHVPVYYATGVASSVVALVAIAVLDEPPRMLVLGYGMGLIAWCSCVYLASNATRIAREFSTDGARAIHAAQQAAAPVGRGASMGGRE